jgi:predicted GNAT family acetyltransferase
MVAMQVHATDDAATVRAEAADFLLSRPVEHNLIITLLDERGAHPEPGRYWWVQDAGTVVGVVFQSPLAFIAATTPMPAGAIAAVVARVATDAPDLPGIGGDADTVARFAGRWAEATKMPARPVEAQRLYELHALRPPTGVPGALRPADASDEAVVCEWVRGFERDTGGHGGGMDAVEVVRRRTAAGLLWIWDDGGPAAMALYTKPSAGVSRVGVVYTPPARRRRGYAAATVAAISTVALEAGASRCILFTQLENPQSNAIYRRLGYEAVSEQLRYRFGALT